MMLSNGSEPSILLVYGEGGHEAQMDRLVRGLNGVCSKRFVALTDSKKRHDWCEVYFRVGEVRSKYRKGVSEILLNSLKIFWTLFKIRRKRAISVLISTGPGVSVAAALFFKLFGQVQIVHIETWSRFYSRSYTGRLMYKFADVFYIQNRELSYLYPKAIYSGRL